MLTEFVKQKRKEVGSTQEEFVGRVCIALTVIYRIEQVKTNLNLEKVKYSFSKVCS